MGLMTRGSLFGAMGVLLLCCAPVARAQPMAMLDIEAPVQEDPAKNKGFSVKKEDQKLIEQFEDFERFRDKKVWDKAFKALDAVLAANKAGGMTPAKDGFWIPTRQKIFRSLVTLPPEGRDAYRLFNDAKAKQAWDQIRAHEAAGDADTLAQLKSAVDQFFVTEVGDKAADHLGDALFESGDFTGAARVWEQVVRYAPGTSLSTLRLQLKQATALWRAGRTDQFKTLTASIREKHAGEMTKLGGKDVAVDSYIDALIATPTTTPSTQPSLTADPEALAAGPAVTLPARDQPAWQSVFMDEQLAEKIFSQLNNNGWGQQMGGMARVVPAAATDGKRVYVNWYGIVFAVDVASGKLVWWSKHFKELGDKFNELIQWQVDPSRFTINVVGDSLLTVAVKLDKLNNQEPFRLSSLEPATGKVKWSSDTGALSGWAFIGAPLVVDGTIYVTAHPKDNQEIHLLSIALADGKMQWETTLGQPQVGNNWRGMPVYSLPVLKHAMGMVYVMTNNGSVIALDTVARSIEWSFSYPTPPPQNENNRMWGGNQMQKAPIEAPATAVIEGGILYYKDRAGTAIYALDLSEPKLAWKRPAEQSDMLAGMDGSSLYLVGSNFSVIDRQSRVMQWSPTIPVMADAMRPLIAGSEYLVFTSRGIYRIDPAKRDVNIFRGYERDVMGGVMLRIGDKLVTVSNVAITAYPLSAGAAGTSASR